MKKKQIVFLHFFYWLLILSKNLFTFFTNQNRNIDILNVTIFIASFLGFYVNYLFVAPRFFNARKLYFTIIGYFVGVAFFVIFRYSLEEILLPKIAGFRNYAEETSLLFYFYDNIYYSSLTIFVSTSLWLFTYYSKLERERIQLIEERKNAELQALKTQINPHFIFNSLNNIYSLVYQNSEKALPAIEKLGELLRYITKDLEQEFISLDKEIGYIESLIELEKLRIRKPELLTVQKSINHPKLAISPMILVPFVENAFKHGDFRDKGFVLKISEDLGKLHFYLQNFKSVTKEKDMVSGIGIQNVKKRLDILYPTRYELKITETESEFIVDLNIDLSS